MKYITHKKLFHQIVETFIKTILYENADVNLNSKASYLIQIMFLPD